MLRCYAHLYNNICMCIWLCAETHTHTHMCLCVVLVYCVSHTVSHRLASVNQPQLSTTTIFIIFFLVFLFIRRSSHSLVCVLYNNNNNNLYKYCPHCACVCFVCAATNERIPHNTVSRQCRKTDIMNIKK